jgi:rRNA maturation protein Rpf1
MPSLIKLNRGKMSLYEIAEKAAELHAEKIVIIDRWKGGPGRIRFYKIGRNIMSQVRPQIYICGVKFQREFKGFKRVSPVNSLFIDETDDSDREVKRLKEELSSFFSIPLVNRINAEAKYSVAMHFSVDVSGHIKISFYSLPGSVEIGPRITVSHVVW